MHRPAHVGGCEATDEVVLEGLDGAFGRVHSVVVGLNKLPLALFGLEERLEGHSCLVVGDVQQGLMPLLDQDVEDALQGVNDGFVLHIWN